MTQYQGRASRQQQQIQTPAEGCLADAVVQPLAQPQPRRDQRQEGQQAQREGAVEPVGGGEAAEQNAVRDQPDQQQRGAKAGAADSQSRLPSDRFTIVSSPALAPPNQINRPWP